MLARMYIYGTSNGERELHMLLAGSPYFFTSEKAELSLVWRLLCGWSSLDFSPSFSSGFPSKSTNLMRPLENISYSLLV